MFNYIIQTVEQLMLASLLTGLMLAYIYVVNGERYKRITNIGLAIGIIAAIAMAYIKNATSKINTGYWNLGIFSAGLVVLILFLLFVALENRVRQLHLAAAIAGTVLFCLQLFYAVPDALAYTWVIYQAEKTAVSTDFLIKWSGVIIGFVIAIVSGIAIYRAANRLDRRMVLVATIPVLLANAYRQVCSAISIMLARRFIPSNHTLFTMAKNASNYSDWFIYIALLMVMVVVIVQWARSLHVNEPYSNPAEHRKIRAKWQSIRRWSTTSGVCALLTVLIMTVVDAYVNRAVELSPIEDALIQDGNVYVSFDQVNDGHLHRFGYTTDSGTVIRFIVIQKPGSSSYGIGLDACDICGETGYYEKDDQVVCNLCDVVMNTNTIGFKGGCNPIVIDYTIQNGYIIVPIEGLVEYESEFK